MSGSSVVTARRASFTLRVESPRMHFGANTTGESSWHARWKEKVRAAVPAFEAALAAPGLPPLAAYSKQLPLCGRATKGPCRLRLELRDFGLGQLEVAMAAPPSTAEISALRRAVRREKIAE